VQVLQVAQRAHRPASDLADPGCPQMRRLLDRLVVLLVVAPPHRSEAVHVGAAHRLLRLTGEQDVGVLCMALLHGPQRVSQSALAVVGERKIVGQG